MSYNSIIVKREDDVKMSSKYDRVKKAYKIGSILFCTVAFAGAFGGNWIKNIHLPKIEMAQEDRAMSAKPGKKHKLSLDRSSIYRMRTENKKIPKYKTTAKSNVVLTISEERSNNRKTYKKVITSQNGKLPKEYEKAVKLAEEYADDDGISKEDMYEQLYSHDGENLSKPASQYAIDHIKINWKQQATRSAQGYIDDRLIKTKHELVEQLTGAEQFTKSQAEYATNKVCKKE